MRTVGCYCPRQLGRRAGESVEEDAPLALKAIPRRLLGASERVQRKVLETGRRGLLQLMRRQRRTLGLSRVSGRTAGLVLRLLAGLGRRWP